MHKKLQSLGGPSTVMPTTEEYLYQYAHLKDIHNFTQLPQQASCPILSGARPIHTANPLLASWTNSDPRRCLCASQADSNPIPNHQA